MMMLEHKRVAGAWCHSRVAVEGLEEAIEECAALIGESRIALVTSSNYGWLFDDETEYTVVLQDDDA